MESPAGGRFEARTAGSAGPRRRSCLHGGSSPTLSGEEDIRGGRSLRGSGDPGMTLSQFLNGVKFAG